MNLVNLFGNKDKQPEPEYFLAVEIHESLIKTALWEILDTEPSIVNVGSFESWEDENSLINGVDMSLDQATKTISSQPKRVIIGLPDSWMEEDKIHPTKIKLVSRLCKDLGLEPIGAVTINRAVAHYLKKKEGVPPTIILLEIYTTKVALSYIYLGEVKSVEEVAKSGDIARDVEEGLTRMDLPNYPARFILTNGTDMMEESQQITAYPWQERLPFKHLPKVEVLPVDFSIKAVALIGGTEAVKFMGIPVNNTEGETHNSNLIMPSETTPSLEEYGFSYEEVAPPPEVVIPEAEVDKSVKYAFHVENEDEDEIISEEPVVVSPRRPKFSLPRFTFPKLTFPKLKFSLLPIILVVLFLIGGMLAYLYFGEAIVILRFSPQKFSRQIDLKIGSNIKTLSGATRESINTTGQATVGDKAVGTITIANKTVAPLSLKAGTLVTTDNGKYSYALKNAITVASASADLLDIISGKTTGVEVVATKIGAEYNLSKDSTFSVDGFSRTIALALAEKEFTGGSSRTVNAVSKEDQDKLLAQASEKIKAQTSEKLNSETPGEKSLPVSEINFTKKQFDHNVGEEATTVALDLAGSVEVLVYSESQLFSQIQNEIKKDLPAGTTIQLEGTSMKLSDIQKVDGQYQAKVNLDASLYPIIDQNKLANFIKGKVVSSLRHFFEPIQGFQNAEIKIYPPLPLITKIMPLRNISFQLVGN